MDTTTARRRPGSGGLPIEVFFDGKPPWFVLTVGLAFVIGTGVVDRLTGPGAFLPPLYLTPVLLVTWNVGRGAGLAIAGLAAIATQVAGITDADASNGLVPSWNAVMWLVVLVFVVWMLSTLKQLIRTQRLRIAHQAEESDDLREMNEVKDTLLHAVSHDLKGPLSGILGAVQTIRRRGELELTPAEVNDLYGVIEEAGTKANRLVDDLLDLDRLKRGQLRPERTPTDVGALARDVVRGCDALAGHPVRIDADDVLVSIDAPKVERVIENLVANAGRHTPPGTPIHVTVRRRTDGVRLEVADEGPGVPDAIKELVFEAFEQGDHNHGGVGIGLSLVRRFAELHGGQAYVDDADGGGALFVVDLPGEMTPRPAAALRAV
ncbi:MAG TPA: ATP-binding protein [Actinomycetota bacterium]|nr:ATP-binding protein [Actinomycetota bacterium]